MDYVGNRILSDVRIKGNIKSEKDICLDGVIEGNVHSAGQVIINEKATVDGDVECDVLIIHGQITGNVCVARKTIMGASAEIQGGLITATLEITPGAKIGKGLRLKNASK